jgi:hypothetical protein
LPAYAAPAALRDGAQRVEIERGAGEVHRNDQFRPRGQGRCDAIRRRHQRVGVDVDEHGRRPAQHDEIDRGNPGHRGRYHFIAGPDAERVQDQVHPGRGRRQRDRVATAHRSAEPALELGALAARRDPAGLEHFSYRGDVLRRDRRAREGQEGLRAPPVIRVILTIGQEKSL